MNAKILRPALRLLICLIAIIVCLTAAGKFEANTASPTYVHSDSVSLGDYSVTDYSYYGGDAYTGIQQAGADASNNVVVMGITVTKAANMLYDAQRSAANNAAYLASPMNSAATGIAQIGKLLSYALAMAFALPGVNTLLDLIQIIRETRAEAAATVSPTVTAAAIPEADEAEATPEPEEAPEAEEIQEEQPL